MPSNYKKLGDYIQLVDIRNRDLKITNLTGLSINKIFMPSVANIIGTDMANYKIINKDQFACSVMQVRRDKKMPLALWTDENPAIISQAYPVFEIIDKNILLPEYLMMWFTRKEFDRHACFLAVGGVRGSLEWEDFCDMTFPLLSLEKQKELVEEYHIVQNRIDLNKKLCEKLEETAQTIYRHWFEDFEFPVQSQSDPELVEGYKSSGGEMVECEELGKEIPVGWRVGNIGDVSILKYGKMLDSDKFLNSGFPVFSGYGVRGYYSEYLYEEPQILVLCRGVSGTGEVKMSPAYSYITNLSIVLEINKSNKLVKKAFLYNYLKNENLRKLDSGSAQSQITIGDLELYKVLLPNLNIQERFEEANDSTFQKIDYLLRSNKKLEEMKGLLLGKMAVENYNLDNNIKINNY